MDDILHFQTAAAAPGAPIGYRDAGNLWLFAGEHYRPSFLMILRRRSPDGEPLWLLLRRLPRRVLEAIAIRHGQVDRIEAGAWDNEDLRDYVERMIQLARVKLFKLEPEEQSRLYDPDDPLVSRAEYGNELPAGAPLPQQLRHRRLQLAEELGSQLMRRWLSKDAGDSVYWSNDSWWGGLERALIVTGGQMQAVGEGAVAFACGIVDFFKTLWKVGKVMVEATANGIRFYVDYTKNIVRGDIDAALKQLHAVGLKIRGGYEELKRLAAEGVRWLNQLNDDPHTRRILVNYFVGLKSSISDVDRQTLPVRVVTEFGLEVVLTVAAGLATAGVGAVVNVARKVGQFAGRVIELLIEIVRLMRRVRVQHARRPPELTARLEPAAPHAAPVRGRERDVAAAQGRRAGLAELSLDDVIRGLRSSSGVEAKQFAREIARRSTHASKSVDRVVLGRWLEDGYDYRAAAVAEGGVWYETDPRFFAKLSEGLSDTAARAKAWAVNEAFLELQLEGGVGRIDLHGESIREVLTNPARRNSFTAMEIKYLETNSARYGYVRDGNSWLKVKGGG